MDEIEYIKKCIKYCDIEVTKKGKWLIHRTVRTITDLAEEKKDFSPWKEYSQWGNYISSEIVKYDSTNEPIPDDYIKEEWFQLEVIKNIPRYIHYFEHLATVNVLECGIEKHGESVIAFLNSNVQRDLLQNANYADIKNRSCILNEILKSSKSYVFREYILKIVHKTINASQENISSAIDAVLKNVEQYECYAECALELAENGNDRAQKVIINHPEIGRYKEHILKIVHKTVNTSQENISSAIDAVLKNVEQYERFAECALELAENGNDRAQKVIINHPEIGRYKEHILKIVHKTVNTSQENISSAIDAVLKNVVQDRRFAECALKLAENGNDRAKRIIIIHPEKNIFKNYIIGILSGKIECSNENINLALKAAMEFECSYKNVNYISRVIMDYPEEFSYSSFIVDVALEKRECSKEMVEKAQDIVRSIIIKNLKTASRSLPWYDIIRLADIYPEALDFIWQNLDDIHFRNYFVTKILNANQDFEISEIKNRLWKNLLKENGLPDDVSNQIKYSYQEEYGKLNLTDFKAAAKSVVEREAANNICYTIEQWNNALLAKGIPADKLNHSFFKFESWQKNRNMKWLETDSYNRYENAVKKGLIQIAISKKTRNFW